MSDLLGIGSVAAAAIGAASHASDESQAQQNYLAAVAAFQKIGVPTAAAQQLALEHMKSAGQLTPQLEQTISQGQSNLSSIAPNQQDRTAQMNALQSLQQLGSNGGEMLSDKANLNNTMSQIATKNRGAQQAILANANSRGQLGSGQALAAQLDSAQNSADQANQNGLSINAQAQQRALQAIQSGGQLGGQMESQDYNQKANAAQAQDAINRFNTMNRQATGNQNAGIQNAAQQYNLTNAQNISNQNTSIDNYQQQYNQGLQQQQYEDTLQKTAGETGQLDKMGQANQNQAQSDANMWGGISSGLAKAWGATSGGSGNSNTGTGAVGTTGDNTAGSYAGSYSPDDQDKQWT